MFDYPLDLTDATPFQRAVWAAMRTIPYGETQSYQWIARRIGRPRAARAVGNACGRNPVAIVQPCHRVVGYDGKLGGFSGGLDLKKALLKLEGVDLSKFG
jgi:methylated-DNA-[protein]-cysteine S-methyltransferase